MLKTIFYFLIIFSIFFNSNSYKEYILNPFIKSNTFKIFSKNGHGTSFIYNYNKKQYLVTNSHVCKYENNMAVQDNNKFTLVKVLHIDRFVDICLMEPLKGKLGFFGNVNYIEDEELTTYGFAMDRLPQIKRGIFSSYKNVILPIFQITDQVTYDNCLNNYGNAVAINIFTALCVYENKNLTIGTLSAFPGQSGSPVLNSLGQLKLIIFVTTPNYEAVAIKTETLNKVINNYEASK